MNSVISGFWRWVWRLGTPFIAAFLLYAALPELGPAYEAAAGKGIEGTFTATHRKPCRGKGCKSSLYGDFVSNDGKVVRRQVVLDRGFDTVRVGDRVAALDTGSRAAVFPKEGSFGWLTTTAVVISTILALLIWSAHMIYLIHRKETTEHPIP